MRMQQSGLISAILIREVMMQSKKDVLKSVDSEMGNRMKLHDRQNELLSNSSMVHAVLTSYGIHSRVEQYSSTSSRVLPVRKL